MREEKGSKEGIQPPAPFHRGKKKLIFAPVLLRLKGLSTSICLASSNDEEGEGGRVVVAVWRKSLSRRVTMKRIEVRDRSIKEEERLHGAF